MSRSVGRSAALALAGFAFAAFIYYDLGRSLDRALSAIGR